MLLSLADIRNLLDQKVQAYNCQQFIENDPVSVPHLFSKREDREIAGFFSATLAWGQRKTIIRNARKLMQWMDYSPHNFIMHHSETDLQFFRNFVHRTFNGEDCLFFIRALKQIYLKYESMEKAFQPEDVQNSEIIKSAIYSFRKRFLYTVNDTRSAKHIANPMSGSSAKRINMFLRWMIRKDSQGVDFGIWKSFSPADLMMPLDIHSGTTARQLGLLYRKQNDWKAVEELTNILRSFDPKDPVKYDFALFGIGINNLNSQNYV